MAGISLGSNIAALAAKRGLDTATSASSRVFERLASGLRINRASDDAAGLAIASTLNSDSRVFSQGIRNINDGLSTLSIADSTVSNLSDIVIRLRELAEQSANGAFSFVQRRSLDREAQELSKEYFRISRSAKFNGLNLFDGSLSQGLRLQGGYGIDGSVQSLLGGALGSGTLNAQSGMANGLNSTYGMQVADVNRDGIQDLVSVGTTSSGAGAALVQIGNGDGSFKAANSFATDASGSTSLAIGDINRDGIMDLVAGGYDGVSGVATVLLGNGDGSFSSGTSYALAEVVAKSMILSDLNGDGILDISSSGAAGAGSSIVTIRLGSADGTFNTATSYDMGIFYSAFSGDCLRVGDLNGDGALDLVCAGGTGSEGALSVRLGSGSGTFGNVTTFATGAVAANTTPRAVALADVNRDGNLDVVTTCGALGAYSLNVSLGRGDGSFSIGASYTGSGNSRALSLADLNGDGALDVILSVNGGGISTRLGQGDGTFGAESTQTITSTGAYNFATGDVNGDGVIDVFAAGLGTITALIGGTRDGINPLLDFSLKTQADSFQAMGYLDRKLASLSSQRGVIGAFQSRLTTALANLNSSRENFTAAASRITDTDVASDSATLVRTQIIQQAATAVLGQANQLPALALQLLRA